MIKNVPDRAAPVSKDAAATRQQIRGLSSLPPLPRRSQELLQLLFDPDLNLVSLAGLVEQTPALAARMIGVANSAFFSPRTPVDDIPDAIIRVLGLNLVRDLSVSFVLNQPFDLRSCRRFQSVRFWVTSMESAVLARLLATRLPLRYPPTGSSAYLGGLSHRLGLLALVHLAPEAMDRAFAELSREPDRGLRAVERAVLGLDHAVAGAQLASAWKLPPTLAAVMGPLENAGSSDAVTTLMSLVALCGRIRKVLRGGEEPGTDAEIKRSLALLEVDTDVLPAIVAQWREDTVDIERLATAFARPGR